MKKINITFCISCCLFGLTTIGMAESSQFSNAGNSLMDFLQDRVEVGTRVIKIELEDTSREITISETGDRNGFLGSITELEDDTDSSPTRFFIDVLVNPYWGFEWSYDKIGATTVTSPEFGEVKSDGSLELSGHIWSVFARYPNKTGVTPYGGIGYVFYESDFDEEPHWALGYPNPSAYAAAGSPSEPLGGRRRTMNVDDVSGLVVYGGAIWKFHEHFGVDFYWRYIDVEVDARFIGEVNGNLETDRRGKFPMEHIGYGLSLHYIF